IDNYDVIYLGYPNYWGSMPMCVFTFLEKFDFTGKIIRPFCTHEGSGFGNSIEELKSVCKGAKIEKGLAVVGSAARAYDEAIREWIDESFKVKN
ncbi:MAG: flavodoxin, partial [Catonella sp.]